MKSCDQNVPGRRTYLPRAHLMLAINRLTLVIFITFSLCTYADVDHASEHNAPTIIDISFSEKGCSLTAEQAQLVDVLHELGKAAGFKLKTFAEFSHEKKNWMFHPMPLPRLLDNLLRGYSSPTGPKRCP